MIRNLTDSPRLGVGIYRIADIARYARIPDSTVRNWFTSMRLFEPEMRGSKGDSVASFFDLIDAIIAQKFREAGVPMKEVRRAYAALQEKLGTKHPFCHRRIYTDGRRIIYDAARGLDAPALEEAVSGQKLFKNIRRFLQSLSFSKVTELAERWRISGGVAIDPQVSMGHPVVDGTGVSTAVIRNAYYANDCDARFVAALYGLSADQVRDAVAFEDGIRSAA